MFKTTVRHSKKANEYDFHQDIEKIKKALANATWGATSHAKDVLSQSVDDIKDRSVAAQETIEGYVHKKPLKIMGVALLTGIVLGYFLHK
jgi:ElaB/YqjD/DUF883 family membrane-anchored ribosome-binding protein